MNHPDDFDSLVVHTVEDEVIREPGRRPHSQTAEPRIPVFAEGA